MYCSNCGGFLETLRDLSAYWAEAYRCSTDRNHTFIRIIDSRWIYPLLNLQMGVADAINEASEETLKLAFSRIKRIDYKTVSVVFFEHTLLHCYDETQGYRVVYPDGSSI